MEKIHISLKSEKNNGYFTSRPMRIYDSTSQKLLIWENFSGEAAEKIKTHILCAITFSRKSCHLCENLDKNTVQPDTTIKYGASAFHAVFLRLQTQHSEYAVLISFTRQSEPASVLCIYVHWPFLLLPTVFAILLCHIRVYLLPFFLFELLYNLYFPFFINSL